MREVTNRTRQTCTGADRADNHLLIWLTQGQSCPSRVAEIPLNPIACGTWHSTRHVLEQVGGAHDGHSGEATAVDGRRRPWELRSVIHAKFKSFVEEGRANVPEGGERQHPASWLARVREDGILHSMDGAIELR